MNKGWIKIHRGICDSAIFNDAEALKLWIYILCNAAHKDHDTIYYGKVVHLKKGEFITGRKVLSQKLCTTEYRVHRTLLLLEKLGNVHITSNNRFTLVSVVNWGKYQDDIKKFNSKSTANQQQINNRSTTNQQQTNTTEECKECKECKEGEEVYTRARSREDTPPTPPTLEEIRLFCSERCSSVNPVRFYNYNASRNWQGVADWKLKIEEWEQNEYASEDKAKADKLGAYTSAGSHGKELDLGAFDEAVSDGGWTYEV